MDQRLGTVRVLTPLYLSLRLSALHFEIWQKSCIFLYLRQNRTTLHSSSAVSCWSFPSFDHFHLTQHFSKAIDKLRIQEARRSGKKHKDIYRGTRWLLLRNPENINEKQQSALERLLAINGKLSAAYILREQFREIFKGFTSHSRLIRLNIWIKEAENSGIRQIREFSNLVRKWEPYIKNSLRERRSNAFSEGLNNKVRVIQRMAYGYKDFEYLRLKIFQQFNFRNTGSLYDL